jgi:hypothetical protein
MGKVEDLQPCSLPLPNGIQPDRQKGSVTDGEQLHVWNKPGSDTIGDKTAESFFFSKGIGYADNITGGICHPDHDRVALVFANAVIVLRIFL